MFRSCRYDTLDKAGGPDKVSVADVWKQLDAVHQGRATVQAMVFEPTATKVHLAFGAGPATRLPLRELALGKLFTDGFGGKL